MAHIADFMVEMVETTSLVGLNNYIARELSPNSPQDGLSKTPMTLTPEPPFVWRMHQPIESRKYQLFPAKEKVSISAGRKSPDAESLLSSTMKAEKSALRQKPKEPNLVRRRKVSVPELGPMTTVQEVPMDSPTIPGRPPLHERSISAPGNSWRQRSCGENILWCIDGPALDETAETAVSQTISLASQTSRESSPNSTPKEVRPVFPKQPLSPKTLAPLIIPGTSAPQPQRVLDSSKRVSDSTPPEVPPKSARMTNSSPYSKSCPFTPMSASTISLSTSTAPNSLNHTPNSAPGGRSSPSPWRGASPNPATIGHNRGQSEVTHRAGHVIGHRRGESEASIIDRGRPKKRLDGSPYKQTSIQEPASSEEVKAFESLPQGYRAADAPTLLPASEIDSLRRQALGQASRWEVLSSKDVEALSRELRSLDERCEYLRKTHRALRSGRRNLHDRICSYLRSPRVARFSHESILKQEESLSELDASIDDWVSKLEQAENRRTRVRQKLLEHVAAALILQPIGTIPTMRERKQAPTGESTPPRSPTKSPSPPRLARAVSPTATGVEKRPHAPAEVNTPPRSPTKSARPQQLATPIQVASPEVLGRCSVESIRIYADSDVYTLLADVEDEINRMGDQAQAEAVQERYVFNGAAINAGMMLNSMTFSPPPRSNNTSGRSTPHNCLV